VAYGMCFLCGCAEEYEEEEESMSSSANVSNCPHVLAVGSNTWDDVYRKKQVRNSTTLD
jgi:hypothetical protein